MPDGARDANRVYKDSLPTFGRIMLTHSFWLTPLTFVICILLPHTEKGKWSFLSIYSLWVLGLPIWFYYEATRLFDWENGNPEKIKSVSDLGQKCWAAVLIVLGVIYLAKFGVPLEGIKTAP
jgi:hypothetical protein